MRNERGVALLIVLVVVALLTITVVEFTYSVQLDQHRVRNSLHALQAALMARSGVNLAEGFLMVDEEPRFDAETEEWWMALQEFCQGLDIGPTTRIKCRVVDESGKININKTRGRLVDLKRGDRVTGPGVLREAMRRIFEAQGIDVEIPNRLAEYWNEELPELPDGRPAKVPDFASLEDFGATFSIPNRKLQRLRRVLTAKPHRWMRRININTASPEVLAAVINDGEAVSAIVDRRGEEPFKSSGEIGPLLGAIEHASVIRGLFTVQSRLYRLEASAITNVDPTAPRAGGIGQTLSVLVLRLQNRGGHGEGPRWTLRPLDWQKEGGARLFWRSPDEERLDSSDELSARDGSRFN